MADRLLTATSNRRLDNQFNIFEGLTKNWLFIGISAVMCGGQVLIVMVGGTAFRIAEEGQSPTMWATAIVLGLLSIPVGVIIRLIPDEIIVALVPGVLKRKHSSKVPGINVSDDEERFTAYPAPLADIHEELAWLKRVKGGRLNNLKFAMKHPRETFLNRSPVPSREHSRSNSIHRLPQTPVREDSYGSTAPTPESRRRSRSNRSRSNSVLGAATVMTGIVAGSIAAGWSPIEKRGEPDFGQFPPKPSPLGQEIGEDDQAGRVSTDERREVEGSSSSSAQDVPIINVPKPKSPSTPTP